MKFEFVILDDERKINLSLHYYNNTISAVCGNIAKLVCDLIFISNGDDGSSKKNLQKPIYCVYID